MMTWFDVEMLAAQRARDIAGERARWRRVREAGATRSAASWNRLTLRVRFEVALERIRPEVGAQDGYHAGQI